MKAEELAALGQHRMAKVFDVILLLALIGFFTVIPHVSRMLYMGDWDFWVDWKDKLWWPIAGPSAALLVTAVGHYLAWYYLRLPLGATFTAVFVLVGAWLSRVFSFYGMEYYPINFIWPATTIPMALALDLILFWSRSYLVTSLIGGFLWGFLFYPVNWLMLMPFLQPVTLFGKTFTVADLMGYYFIRPQTPEYLRRIDEGTLQAFLGQRIWISILMAGIACTFMYWIGIGLGKLLGIMPMRKVLRQT